jgi:glycosyltransferase involved in cell wall biosynthesis
MGTRMTNDEIPSGKRSEVPRVMHIWYADYPWDVRVQKVIVGLQQRGWFVDLVARNKRNLAHRETVDGAVIHRLRSIRFLGRSLNGLLSFPAFLNPRWIKHIWRVARQTKPDVILVRDLPLAPAAIWVGQLLKTPVVLDMAEDYPGLLRALWENRVAKPMDRLVRNPTLASFVERWVLRRIDGVVCVIEESAARVRSLGVAEAKITVVRNTPMTIDVPSNLRSNQDAGEELLIAYLGLIERHRGVHDLIRAVAECRKRNWPVKLVVVGDGVGLPEIQKLATELGVLGRGVELLGRLENRRALDVIAKADVGAIPHIPCDAWNSTIPNKLFDYMSLGLPVLASDVPPVQRIVIQEACGVCYRSGDIMDLVSKIEELRSRSARKRMAAAGMAAITERYNWTNDSERLDAALRRVLPNSGRLGEPEKELTVGR